MSGCIGCPHQRTCEWIQNNLGENMHCNQDHPLRFVGYVDRITVLHDGKHGTFSQPIEHKVASYK